MLLAHLMRAAASRTFCTAGRSRPISTAMIAMTTSNSINVNPFGRVFARMVMLLTPVENQEEKGAALRRLVSDRQVGLFARVGERAPVASRIGGGAGSMVCSALATVTGAELTILLRQNLNKMALHYTPFGYCQLSKTKNI